MTSMLNPRKSLTSPAGADANLAASFVAKWVQPKCGNSCEQYMSAFALATAQRFGGRSASRQALLEGFVDADLM